MLVGIGIRPCGDRESDVLVPPGEGEEVRYGGGALAPRRRRARGTDAAGHVSGGEHVVGGDREHPERPLGSVRLHHIVRDHAATQVGYWVGPWARGRGIATTAVRLAVSYAFTELELSRVSLYHAVEYRASCGIARGAGFRLEGETRRSYRYADGQLHDEHVHGVLADEWNAYVGQVSVVPATATRRRTTAATSRLRATSKPGRAVTVAARAGLAARGCFYLLLAGLVLNLAVEGRSGPQANANGALSTIASTVFGETAIVAAYRFLRLRRRQAVVGVEGSSRGSLASCDDRLPGRVLSRADVDPIGVRAGRPLDRKQ